MSITERLKYLTNLVIELVAKTKNIGQLDTASSQEIEGDLFAPVYLDSTAETKKVNLKTYFQQEIGEVPGHTQSYSSIEGIGDFKEILIPDTNNYNWRVKRIITDETNDSFKENDILYGLNEDQSIYYEALVTTSGAIAIPADLEDKTKVFHINKKLVI